MHKFHMETLNPIKLTDVEVKENSRVKTSNRFGVLENLDDEVDSNRTLEKYCIKYQFQPGRIDLQQNRS